MRKVAVTGGLSSGKSSVCRFFKECGAYVVSADEVVHQLLSPDTNLGKQIIRLLGPDIVKDKQMDRAKIAQKVFEQPQLLKSLEQILHPAVREEMEHQYQTVKDDPHIHLFVAEIPLLFETGGNALYDQTIAVLSSPEKCMERFVQSTGYGRSEYEKRMSRQLSPSEKAERADFVILNHGSLNDMRQAVEAIYKELIDWEM